MSPDFQPETFFDIILGFDISFWSKMENVARTFKVEFIVNLSELGKKDPLMQNVRPTFQSFNESASARLLCSLSMACLVKIRTEHHLIS